MLGNYGTPPITLVKGDGCRVWDTEGNSYIDALAGVAVSSLGHAHPAITTAVLAQIGRIAHTSNLYAHPPGLALAKQLRNRFHGRVFFANSGTEANEAALKLVRRHAHHTGRPDGVVVAFERGFHGRTSGSLALTANKHYQEGFSPLPGQIVHIPFNDLEAIRDVFANHDVVGVFVEMIQGEGGVVPIETEVAQALRHHCDVSDALLVIDEVQTGVGRTGTFFAFEHHDITPDIVTLAKGIAGGMPLGVMMCNDRLAPLLGPGSHGSTFGGNPVSCAAALAVLRTVNDQALMPQAARLGQHAIRRLRRQGIEARGQGLLIGIPHERPADVVKQMREHGVLVGVAGKAIRLAPPLIMDDETWNTVIDTLVACLKPTVQVEA